VYLLTVSFLKWKTSWTCTSTTKEETEALFIWLIIRLIQLVFQPEQHFSLTKNQLSRLIIPADREFPHEMPKNQTTGLQQQYRTGKTTLDETQGKIEAIADVESRPAICFILLLLPASRRA
jgi:hypothetical protein